MNETVLPIKENQDNLRPWDLNRTATEGSVILSHDNLSINDVPIKFELRAGVDYEQRDLRVSMGLVPKIVKLMASRKINGPWHIQILDGSKEEEGHEHFQLSISNREINNEQKHGKTTLKIGYSQSYPNDDEPTGIAIEEGVISVIVQAGTGVDEDRNYGDGNETVKKANDRGTALSVAVAYQIAIDKEYQEYELLGMPGASIQQPNQEILEWGNTTSTNPEQT
jgi:hypothetical protein